jgi:hypothetical protein
MSRIPDADERIARLLGQRTTEQNPIVVSHGTDPLPARSDASAGQTDATLRFDAAEANRADAAQREAQAAEKMAVKEITMPDTTPTVDDIAIIGDVSIVRSKISGYERSFTRNPQDFIVYLGDEQVEPSKSLGVVFDALRAASKRAGK